MREVFLRPDNKGLTRQPTYGTVGCRVSRYFINQTQSVSKVGKSKSTSHGSIACGNRFGGIESKYVDFEIGEFGSVNLSGFSKSPDFLTTALFSVYSELYLRYKVFSFGGISCDP